MATFTVYDTAGTSLGTLSPSQASWTHQVGEDGSGSLTVAGDVSSTLLAETVVVRVNDGTSDVFGFVPITKTRRQVEASTEVDLAGPGARWLLHAAQVYQEDTTDCAEPADTRWFGWMSGDYVDADWSLAESFGTFQSGPFATSRPEGWPVPAAEYITPTAAAVAARDWYARKSFTLSAEADYFVLAAADDEYRLFIDGTEILSTIGGGPFQWQRFQQRPIRLCAGTHQIAVQVRNLQRASASTNGTYLIFALSPTDEDGQLRNQNQVWNLYHDHTGGTFTLSTAFGFTTAAIAWNAAAADIESALGAIAIPGAGNVEVTGSNTLRNEKYEVSHDHTGGTFTLSAFGGTTAAIAYNATALQVETALENGIARLNENVTVTGTGTSGDPWVIEFDNGLTLTEVELTGDGSGLTGGTTFTVSNTQDALNDPWRIEFTGDLGSTYVPLSADGTNLTGGAAIVTDEITRGQSAGSVVKSDTSWVVLDDPASVPGLTPGEILRLAVEEAQARGTTVLDDVTLGFTDAADSDGNAWSAELVLPLSLPADVHRLSVVVEELGFDVDVDPDLTLQAWNLRGTDRSGTVSFTAGTAGTSGFVASQDETTVRNVIRARTDQGWFENTDATSVTARGRWEDGIALSGYSTEDEAASVTQPLLDDLATPPKNTTWTIPEEATVVPYDDFFLGDVVSAPAFGTSGFTATDMRVVRIGGVLEEASIVWSIEGID